MRYILEIEKKENRYTGLLYSDIAGTRPAVLNLNFEDTAKIRIRDEIYRLGDLLGGYAASVKNTVPEAYNERGHLAVGQYLYSQIFGNLSAEEQQQRHPSEPADLCIVSPDERTASLPWNLLADKGIFLCAAGWSVRISTKKKAGDCEFPYLPRMLAAAPQPAGFEKTHAENHLKSLTEKLMAGDNLRIARTLEEFSELLREFRPHIVYYYGHGIGDIHKPRLAFAAGESSLRYDITAGEFVRYLREARVPPLIAYINCCRGTAAARLGIGRLLNDFVPAVIVNRTLAGTDVLQSQALHLWESILIGNMSPHRAVSGLYAMMGELPLLTEDARRLTPLLYGTYADWQSLPPAPSSQRRYERHKETGSKEQLQTVCEDIQGMLKKGNPKTLNYVRCSQKEQESEIFHRHLSRELRERLSDTCLYEVRPEWPSDFHQPERSFGDMFAEAFEVSRPEDIPARILSKSRETPFRNTLVYVNHQPVRHLRMITPKILNMYQEWRDRVFVPMLGPRQFALSGVSFIVNNPSEFRKLPEVRSEK